MGNYVIPNVVQRFSGVKVLLWHWLEENIGNQNGPFEINQTKLAEEFGVSRTAIQNALKTFISCNLIEKVESRTGRGNHPLYRLTWTFREKEEKSATSSRANNVLLQEKNITKAQNSTKTQKPPKTFTKGTKVYRYYAMKFRQAVENSTLADHSQRIVSSVIDYLKGEPVRIAKTWLIYLKRWLEEKHKYLGEFFKYFYDILQSLARQKLNTIRQQEEIEKEMKRKAEIRKEYQEDPPPRSKDFTSFSDYLEAMEEWNDKRGGDDPSG